LENPFALAMGSCQNEVDLKILYQILQEELVDIRELYRTLILIIEEHPE